MTYKVINTSKKSKNKVRAYFTTTASHTWLYSPHSLDWIVDHSKQVLPLLQVLQLQAQNEIWLRVVSVELQIVLKISLLKISFRI